MKPFMLAALQQQQQRLTELHAQLSAPDVVQDLQRYRALSQEHAELSDLMAVFTRSQAAQADAAQAQDWLSDPELK